VHTDKPIGSENPAPLILDADRTDATRSAAARLKVIQQALQESEARSRSLFEANPHPMWIYDVATLAFLDVNDAAVAHYGYGRGEFLAMTIADIHLPDDMPRLQVNVARIGPLMGASGVWRHRTKGGAIITVETTCHALDYGGKYTELVLARDVTERTLAEDSRRHREAELREAQRIAGMGSWEWTIATGAVAWSEGLNRIVARDRDLPAPTFDALDSFYTPESWERLGAAIAKTIETGASYELELEMIRVDGTTCWTTTRGEALRGPEGDVVMLRGTVHNIDERKRAEGQLHLQSAALNAAAHSMLITDRDGTIVWINPAYTALTGYSPAEAVGRNPRDLVKSGAQDRAFYEHVWATILAGNVWHGELTNRRKDGTRYAEDQTITPVKDAQGRITHFIAIQRDLTEQRELETQLLQSQKMEAIGTLAGGIAHDFNNILGALLGYAELATENAAGNDALLKDLGQVTAAGQRATDLVRQILTFSRREEPVRHQIHLGSIVREALKLLRASLPASIEFRSRLDPDAPAVLADPSQVHQIIMNLGANAWHAMKDRPGVLEVTVDLIDADAAFVKTHAGLHTGRHVRLSVRDTGHGMAQAMQERIFEPFFTTKAPGEGTGLGLATVHGIMKSHAGEISVESQPEGGTIFHLYFPALAVAVSDAEVVATPVPRGSGQRILFVDDEGGLVKWGTRALESLGYCVTGEQSVVHALAAVTGHPEAYDLVVTDLTMPVMTGIEFAERVWAVRPDLPIILTTGFSTLTLEAVRRLGMGALVLKPNTIKTLGEAVHRVLAPTAA
jgi:PAS domain S-box-containing protein